MKWEFSILEILDVKNQSDNQRNDFAEYLRAELYIQQGYIPILQTDIMELVK
jgi:hypothetical protein